MKRIIQLRIISLMLLEFDEESSALSKTESGENSGESLK